jgi:hypothetical protein
MSLQNKLKKTTTTTTSIKEEKEKKPPKGATIIEQTVRMETEKIENGWLIVKSWDGRYKTKDSNDSYGNWFNYSKKWYSKEDPLTVTLNDKSLADAFDDEDGDED